MDEIILFPEKEIFTKIRPIELTEKLENEFWLKMAKEVIDNGFTQSYHPESIASDLKELSLYDSGFEMAKDLDNKYGYEINSEFVSWLEDLEWKMNHEIEELVKKWVKIHEPKPLFSKGAKLTVNAEMNSKLKKDQIIWITGIKEDTANYLCWTELDHNGGYIITFEKMEASCSICPL